MHRPLDLAEGAAEQDQVMTGFHSLTDEPSGGGTSGPHSGLLAAAHRLSPHNFIGRITINMFRMAPPLDCLKDLSRNEARFRRAATLVSCPIYLSPATTRTKSIRLHQVWQATRSDEADEMQDQVREQDVPKSAARFALDDADDEADQVREATRTRCAGCYSRR
jgi:hypothetical protein